MFYLTKDSIITHKIKKRLFLSAFEKVLVEIKPKENLGGHTKEELRASIENISTLEIAKDKLVSEQAKQIMERIMQLKIGKGDINTSSIDDLRLIKQLEIDYTNEELTTIVACIFSNINIPTNDVLDILADQGFNLVTESDIDYVMMWLKRLKIV